MNIKDFIVLEKCDRITRRDPHIEVLKDIVNQLKGINKHFWLDL